MKAKQKILSLVDMDIGLFVSYQVTSESLTTKLFRFITLNSIPLNRVMDIREADPEEVTPLNRINWFSFLPWRRRCCPVYTLQAGVNTPRIFMKLDRGTHIDLKHTLGSRHGG